MTTYKLRPEFAIVDAIHFDPANKPDFVQAYPPDNPEQTYWVDGPFGELTPVRPGEWIVRARNMPELKGYIVLSDDAFQRRYVGPYPF